MKHRTSGYQDNIKGGSTLLDQLKCLIEYQILEDRKNQLIRGCEETPKRIAEIEKEFEQSEGEYLAKKAEHDLARKAHKSLEQGIQDLETRISRSKSRMNEVKTNKEYQAILKEIEDIRKDIAGREDGALELMENIEALGKELKTLEKDLSTRRQKLEEDRKVLNSESDQLKNRLERLEALQQTVREKLNPELLKRTNFLFKKQAGIAVAAVENGVCQVCHLNIPPQKYIELQKDEVILQCPHCHRFLYWPGHEGYCVKDEDLETI